MDNNLENSQNNRQDGQNLNQNNTLNTSFGTKDTERSITRGFSILPDGKLKFYHLRGLRDQLFLVDPENKRVYAFQGSEIYGIVKSVHQDLIKNGVCNIIELEKGIIPCYWPVEKGCSVWPQANLTEAYQEFKDALKADKEDKLGKVEVHFNSFKGMLRRAFPNDYEKFLRRESELNSVLYDESGKLRETTTFDFDNTPSQDGTYPRLFFAQKGVVFPFKLVSIQGIAAVVNNIRGEMEADGKHFSTTFILTIPSDVKPFIIFPMANEKLWPQHSLQSAYEDFISACEGKKILSSDEFETFLSNCYPSHYERIVAVQDQVSEYVNKTGHQPQIVSINTRKNNKAEPHSDISITAPDGQKWIISHEAKTGTEIDGVCKVIYAKRREGSKREDYTYELIVEDGVEACVKLYGRGAKYPYHYFTNGSVYKEGSSFVFKSSSTPTNQKGKAPLKGGLGTRQEDSEQTDTKPEDNTVDKKNEVLSTEEAIKALKL